MSDASHVTPHHKAPALLACLFIFVAVMRGAIAPAEAAPPTARELFEQATTLPTNPAAARTQGPAVETARKQPVVAANPSDKRFLDTHEDGWFWYKDPRLVQKPKPKLAPQAPSESKDTPLSVEWIRNNIDRLRDQAINNPTKENVEMFLYVHKYMMDLSERFAYTYRSVAEGNMALDETIANPVTAVSRRQISDETEKAQNDVINKLAGQVGIWYFFQSTCPYCLKQNPILDYLLQDAPLSVLPISLDGLPMSDGSHPNWVVDNGQAQKLQVSTTPTMFLVKPDTNEVVLLAAGLRALPELKQRIVEVAYHQKWISKVEYETAMHGLPRRLLTDGVELKEVKPGSSDQELLEVLRSGGIHGGAAPTRSKEEGGNTPWRTN
ncbi:conjugal transfer protein TraF (plasmid) [Xanthomonas sontii]|uniref:conjugal transfer protein TraF n=1 Tax=Xanthomonas sontii TaxID=2650745 RepID=UPI003F87A5B2